MGDSDRRLRRAIATALLIVAGGWIAGCGQAVEPEPPEDPATRSEVPRAEGPLKAIWGPVRLPDGRSAFPVYEELGVQAFQMQLRWERVAPRRPHAPRDPADPAYEWNEEVNEAIRRGAERGIETALLVTGSPGWANGEREWNHAPARDRDFADFLHAAARRYPQVGIWMIWGEPNRADRFRPAGERAAPRYARLLDAAYEALKEASSRNVVVGGMTFSAGEPTPAPFLRALRLPSGRAPRLDWYGHNPYPFRLPDLAERPIEGGFRDLSDLDTFSREVRDHFDGVVSEPRLWLSEFTIQSDAPSDVFAEHVSRDEQAAWLEAGYRAAWDSGTVVGLGWFSLLDQSGVERPSHWGLMSAQGSPKPSFRAYRAVRRGSDGR